MTPQSTFMVTAPIAAERLEDLRALLSSMTIRPGMADPDNSLVTVLSIHSLACSSICHSRKPSRREYGG